MRLLPPGLVVHRLNPLFPESCQVPIGRSRDQSMEHRARPETIDSFRRMNQAAQREKITLHVIWAYRSRELQREQFEEAKLKHGRRNGIRWLAPPGFSEHQTGWVLDLGDADDPEADDNPKFERTKAFRWLKENASKFGFELSFPPGNWQGVSYEPWHWRFVGTREARRAFHPRGFRWICVWTRSWIEALRCWLIP
jgi:zinc D-Ala-D-Ala carboxypeptidase